MIAERYYFFLKKWESTVTGQRKLLAGQLLHNHRLIYRFLSACYYCSGRAATSGIVSLGITITTVIIVNPAVTIPDLN
jgi:hypothetical protein